VPDPDEFSVSRKSKTSGESATTGKDFDDALSQAELLLREVDRSRARLRAVLLVEAGIPLAVAVALTLALSASSASGVTTAVLAAVCGTLTVLAVGWLWAFEIVPALRLIARDEYAMIEIVDVLRELMETVAKREGWSASRQHLARTRIARFPISVRGAR